MVANLLPALLHFSKEFINKICSENSDKWDNFAAGHSSRHFYLWLKNGIKSSRSVAQGDPLKRIICVQNLFLWGGGELSYHKSKWPSVWKILLFFKYQPTLALFPFISLPLNSKIATAEKHLLKMGYPQFLFHLFSVFSNKQYKFYIKSMWKMSIQYLVLAF